MNIEAKPTGSITDRTFDIVSGAAALINMARKITKGIHQAKLRKSLVVTISRNDAISLAESLERSARLIDNLMWIIENRELKPLHAPHNRSPHRTKSIPRAT